MASEKKDDEEASANRSMRGPSVKRPCIGRPQRGNHVLTNHGALKSVHLWHTVSDIPPQTYHLKYTWLLVGFLGDCSTDSCMPIGSLYIRNTKACPYAVQGLSWRARHSICKHGHDT